jgi:ABC-type sulfate transport system permease subunit
MLIFMSDHLDEPPLALCEGVGSVKLALIAGVLIPNIQNSLLYLVTIPVFTRYGDFAAVAQVNFKISFHGNMMLSRRPTVKRKILNSDYEFLGRTCDRGIQPPVSIGPKFATLVDHIY